MFGLVCVHQKRDNISPSFFVNSLQGSTHTLTNLINYPLCFLTAFCPEVTSQLFSWERGGASDVKTQTLTTQLLFLLNLSFIFVGCHLHMPRWIGVWSQLPPKIGISND